MGEGMGCAIELAEDQMRLLGYFNILSAEQKKAMLLLAEDAAEKRRIKLAQERDAKFPPPRLVKG